MRIRQIDLGAVLSLATVLRIHKPYTWWCVECGAGGFTRTEKHKKGCVVMV